MEGIDNGALVALVTFVVAAVILIAAVTAAGKRRRQRQIELAARELAVIVEHVQISAFGGICVVLLFVTVIGSVFGYSAAKTVFQQIEAGVSLIAGCILFGLGAALGQSRTYRVYRSDQREPM